MLKRACAFAMLLTTVACSGNSTTAPAPTTFSLSGQVVDGATGTGISGATVSIADGPNAGKSTTTDGTGNYTFTGLLVSGFTVTVSATNYVSQSLPVTLTANRTLPFTLARITANLAGNWSGTIQFTQLNGSTLVQVVQPISMNLTQSGNTISGTWTTTSAPTRNGTVSGTTTTNSFSGSLTYNDSATNATACTGTLAASGSAGGNNLIWTSPLVTGCTNPPTSIIITAARQ
jgi:hypothetical protein